MSLKPWREVAVPHDDVLKAYYYPQVGTAGHNHYRGVS